ERTTGGLIETGNDIEQRALAAPAWPNKADDLPGICVQVHVLEHSKRLPMLEHIFADSFHPDFGISPYLGRRIGGNPLHGTPHQSCTKRKAALFGRLRVIILMVPLSPAYPGAARTCKIFSTGKSS